MAKASTSSTVKLTAANLVGKLTANQGKSGGVPAALKPGGQGNKPAPTTAKLNRTYIK